MFIDGTCLLGFLVFVSFVQTVECWNRVWASRFGNLEMTLLENNFYFNRF